MAHALSSQTNMSKIQNSNLFTFVATLSGVAIGVLAALAMVGPMVRSEVASATSGLRPINAKPTSSITSCVAPAGGASNAAAVKTAAAVMPEAGRGGDGGAPGSTWVNKFVGGGMNTANVTVSGNNNSPTTVNTTNKNITKINNDNDVHVSNKNVQKAESGDANASDNYNGGSAASGDSSNSNDTSTSISISN